MKIIDKGTKVLAAIVAITILLGSLGLYMLTTEQWTYNVLLTQKFYDEELEEPPIGYSYKVKTGNMINASAIRIRLYGFPVVPPFPEELLREGWIDTNYTEFHWTMVYS